MDKKNKLYFLYVGAVLLAGTVYVIATSGYGDKKSESGRVTVITAETTSAVSSAVTAASIYKTTKAAKTTAATTSTEAETTVVTEPVVLWFDLNAAAADELALLPGIGEKLAAEIVEYRSVNGRFRNIEELMKVSGIGEGKFEAVREYIYVVDPVYDEEITVQDETAYEETPQETEHIPTLEEIAPLDLNKATKEELMLLPHVDETIAQRILDFREQAGGFSHPYELLYIEGLTREKTAEIVEYVKVSE